MNSKNAEQRFRDVVWPHLATVLRVAQILTNRTQDAEDLAQETMLKAFRALDSFQDGSDAKAWLLTILRNTRIDRLRASQVSHGQLSLDAAEIDPVAPPPPDAPEWERSDDPQEILQGFSDRQVIEALQSLPEEIRWTLLLVDVEQVDQKEAAGVLGVPVGTVKSRAHRGRAMLREALLPLARELRLVDRSE